jgi:hypothetical protein
MTKQGWIVRSAFKCKIFLGDGVKFILHEDKIFLALESHGIKARMVIIHAFLTSTRVEVSGQLHALAALSHENSFL